MAKSGFGVFTNFYRSDMGTSMRGNLKNPNTYKMNCNRKTFVYLLFQKNAKYH